MLSSSRTIFDTIWSMGSGSTGRLRQAICTERSNLSRSNGTRRLLRLMTISSRSCTRSKVVKRELQVRSDRALAAGDLHRAQKFIAVERHPPAVALDDDQFAQLHPLESGEAEITGQI